MSSPYCNLPLTPRWTEADRNSVCIASVMRLVAVLTEDTTTDVTWNLVNQAIWANVEADFAIISGTD